MLNPPVPIPVNEMERSIRAMYTSAFAITRLNEMVGKYKIFGLSSGSESLSSELLSFP